MHPRSRWGTRPESDDPPFIHVSVTAPYWTSTICASDTTYAWLAELRTGELSPERKANSYRRILVR